MTDIVKFVAPALTAEEWRKREVVGVAALDSQGQSLPPQLWVYDSEWGHNHIANPHALAALALHEQPFGFSWDEVDALRVIVEEAGGSYECLPDEFWTNLARNRETALRAIRKLAALLPPR